MKLSVSLGDDDVAFLEDYAEKRGVGSRSAVIQRAVALLRIAELGEAYAEAWSAWEAGGDDAAWEATAGDGLADAS